MDKIFLLAMTLSIGSTGLAWGSVILYYLLLWAVKYVYHAQTSIN